MNFVFVFRTAVAVRNRTVCFRVVCKTHNILHTYIPTTGRRNDSKRNNVGGITLGLTSFGSEIETTLTRRGTTRGTRAERPGRRGAD